MSNPKILPVTVSTQRVKEMYGKISTVYTIIEDFFERKARERGLALLKPKKGEQILEIGFGTGSALAKIAQSVGNEGRVYGIDLAEGMVHLAKRRLKRCGLSGRVKLFRGDARSLPFEEEQFNAVYMALTLELFDTPEILTVLKEIKRTLKKEGRVVVVSMDKRGYEDSIFVKVYEFFHRLVPQYLDCRPIYLADELKAAGYTVKKTEKFKLLGVCPVTAVLSRL
ncbi:MAG: methyltransferase domain-containing protein [Candidatus Korarchaeota archaeon]|nr:methyltransferase domain-containing protein [Candidatus Korarchaeota archaeon]NIU84765.1 methyltransferase domain-containing protein [Candidatus Thorarchaeota archaeon]NIW14398.1 methyltransferase domain-containing protein [Candidatus Thorarchaeota archaeon]NIW52839.1 methyltransferase domain-containing protein [Candidatus Korarchaeota archaeon]